MPLKLIFSHENCILANNAKNILESAGISVVLKNEFSSGAAGDLSPFDTWVEVWIINDNQEAKAKELLIALTSQSSVVTKSDWRCESCGETNDPSFDFCWQCQCAQSDSQ